MLWQLVSATGLVSAQKLPPPTTVWHTTVSLVTTDSPAYGTLQGAMLVSLQRMAIGFTFGAVVAIGLALVAGLSRIGEDAGLVREFDGRRVLDGLDLDIAPGKFVALLGVSGTGKSTLLRALAGLDREVTGAIEGPDNVAVAFQEPRLLPWRRVLANVALGLRTRDPQTAARGALAEVGLTERSQAWPLTLSGGEAQRAALARALVREPGLLLLDEPFSALDALAFLSERAVAPAAVTRPTPAGRLAQLPCGARLAGVSTSPTASTSRAIS